MKKEKKSQVDNIGKVKEIKKSQKMAIKKIEKWEITKL